MALRRQDGSSTVFECKSPMKITKDIPKITSAGVSQRTLVEQSS